MVFYVALVAITNICVGFAVGRLLHSPTRWHEQDDEWDVDEDLDGCSESGNHSKQADETAADAEQYDEPNDEQNCEKEVQGITRNVRAWFSEKGEFATQLRDVTDRASYSRASRDKGLLRQAADQVLSCISIRYDELQRTLGLAEGDTSLNGDALSALEMLSAQIETSMSNLRALDWSEAFDDLYVRLDSELSLLNEQHRTLASALRRAKT
jgi:hypothetical protein